MATKNEQTQKQPEQPDRLAQAKEAIGTIRNAEKEAIRQKQELERSLRRVDARLKYSPEDEDLKAERDGIVHALGEQEIKVNDLTERREEAAARLQAEQVKIARDQALEASKEFEFKVPDENPVVACQILASIAGSLQFQFCSSRSYYEHLLMQQARQTGNENSADPADSPVPEITVDLQNQIDEIRERRAYLQALRFAVERDFNAMAEHLPADSSYRPVLLRRTDAEVYRQIDERQEQRIQQMRQQREEARQAVQAFGRDIEDQAYRPGLARAS